MEKVTIISAFPGAGKTTLAEKFGWTDLNFEDYLADDHDKWENFHVAYVDAIEKKIGEEQAQSGARVIFVSAHSQVREEMASRGIRYVCVYPEPSYVSAYMESLNEPVEAQASREALRATHLGWLKSMHEDEGKIGEIKLHKGQPYLRNTLWALLNAPDTAILTVRNTLNRYQDVGKFIKGPGGDLWLIIGQEVDNKHQGDLWLWNVHRPKSTKCISAAAVGRTYKLEEDPGGQLVRQQAKTWRWS